MTRLKGIAWDHSRGFTSIVGVSQRWHELHPNIEIFWEKRSLQDFSDASIDNLAKRYDLLIVDHPWAGFAAKYEILLPLEKYLNAPYIEDQKNNSVGASHLSYNFDGFQSALAIDAATPVAFYRPDRVEDGTFYPPKTFDDVLLLAKRGKVVYSGLPLNLLMDFYMFAVTSSDSLFLSDEEVIEEKTGLEILETMRELSSCCDPVIFKSNPYQIHELLSSSDIFCYCPFAYGYVNYSRRGYSAHRLKAADVVAYKGSMLKTVLGGTGLAISNQSQQIEEALNFVQYALSPETQRTLYFECGGQPGHRQAWLDDENNRQSLDFFKDTLTTLDNAYLRPRYSGHLSFQDHAGVYIQDYLLNGGNPKEALRQMNNLYRKSKRG